MSPDPKGAGTGGGLAGVLAGLGNSATVELQAGTCIYRDGAWRVSRGGMELESVVWLESASPRTGSCLLAIDTPSKGQSVVFVLGFTFSDPFRANDLGTASSATSFGKVNLTLRDGTAYEGARTMAHFSPGIGDLCMLIWKGGEAYVIGGFQYGHNGVSTPKPPAIPELPRGIAGGSSEFAPTTIGRVYSAVALGWAKPKSRDLRLTPTDYATWTYGGNTKGIADKGVVESVTIQLGRRITSGTETTDTVVDFYRTGAQGLTEEAPALLEGPYSVTIPKNYQGAPIDLPLELGEALKLGGSITMKPKAPIAFADSPASGYLNIKWKKI